MIKFRTLRLSDQPKIHRLRSKYIKNLRANRSTLIGQLIWFLKLRYSHNDYYAIDIDGIFIGCIGFCKPSYVFGRRTNTVEISVITAGYFIFSNEILNMYEKIARERGFNTIVSEVYQWDNIKKQAFLANQYINFAISGVDSYYKKEIR